MKQLSLWCLLCAIAFFGFAPGSVEAATAKVPTWRQLPLACLPERAVPWNQSTTELGQQACHCPPTSLCPTLNWPESKHWPDSSTNTLRGTVMPPDLVLRCCPEPVCPRGTKLAGHRIPQGGDCDPSEADCKRKLIEPPTPNPPKPIASDYYGPRPVNPGKNATPAEQAAYAEALDKWEQARIQFQADLAQWRDVDYPKYLKDEKYNEDTKKFLVEERKIIRDTIIRCRDGDCTTTVTDGAPTWCPCPNGYTLTGTTGAKFCERTIRFTTNSSCFIAGTQVTLNDGTRKAIETLTVGDVVKGASGDNKVVKMETPTLDGRDLYRINGSKAFVTAEHPFMTKDGWKSIDPKATALENAALKVGSLVVGDTLVTDKGELKVASIEAVKSAPETVVYNPILSGDRTYFADGFLVHNKGTDCLRYDSLVTLANGKNIAIEQVKVGDVLKGPDGDVTVEEVNVQSSMGNVFYRINDRKFVATGDHPVRTTEGWKAIDWENSMPEIVKGKLEVGDRILDVNGQEVEVKSLDLVGGQGAERAVNLKVKDDKAFYVDGLPVKPYRGINFKY